MCRSECIILILCVGITRRSILTALYPSCSLMNSLFPGKPSVVLVAFSFISTHRHSCTSLSRLVELSLCEGLSRKWAKLTLVTEIYSCLLKAERDSVPLRAFFRAAFLVLPEQSCGGGISSWQPCRWVLLHLGFLSQCLHITQVLSPEAQKQNYMDWTSPLNRWSCIGTWYLSHYYKAQLGSRTSLRVWRLKKTTSMYMSTWNPEIPATLPICNNVIILP